jgi:hypothetical protein
MGGRKAVGGVGGRGIAVRHWRLLKVGGSWCGGRPWCQEWCQMPWWLGRYLKLQGLWQCEGGSHKHDGSPSPVSVLWENVGHEIKKVGRAHGKKHSGKKGAGREAAGIGTGVGGEIASEA